MAAACGQQFNGSVTDCLSAPEKYIIDIITGVMSVGSDESAGMDPVGNVFSTD